MAYYVYDYSFVCDDGDYVVNDGDWATHAPIISPGFDTRDEAWEWLHRRLTPLAPDRAGSRAGEDQALPAQRLKHGS